MKKIYGNSGVMATLERMAYSGKTAHSLIIFGEKGSGRKLLADHYTAALLCTSPHSGAPCGSCRSCRNVFAHSHPDVVYVRTEGKKEGYTVNSAHEVIKDAYIKPNNNTGRKIFIFRDCRKMAEQTQNMLLKLIEEPPDYAYFIFTAVSKYEFLPTIISRCITFGLTECSEEEAAASLRGSGFGEKEIAEAVSCFHGNIGMCEEYIAGGELKENVELTKQLADSIIKKDEYSLNALLFSMGSSRGRLYEVFGMLDKLLRDAAVLSRNEKAPLIGCSSHHANALASCLTPARAAKLHSLIERGREGIESNVNAPLVLAAMAAEISDVNN